MSTINEKYLLQINLFCWISLMKNAGYFGGTPLWVDGLGVFNASYMSPSAPPMTRSRWGAGKRCRAPCRSPSNNDMRASRCSGRGPSGRPSSCAAKRKTGTMWLRSVLPLHPRYRFVKRADFVHVYIYAYIHLYINVCSYVHAMYICMYLNM